MQTVNIHIPAADAVSISTMLKTRQGAPDRDPDHPMFRYSAPASGGAEVDVVIYNGLPPTAEVALFLGGNEIAHLKLTDRFFGKHALAADFQSVVVDISVACSNDPVADAPAVCA